jgi:hypothetical protein
MENSLQVPTEIPHNIPHILHDLPVLDPVGKKTLGGTLNVPSNWPL